MWYSIKSIVKPETLAEAYALQQDENAVLFSGGSYLVAEKSPSTKTLIDINHLLDNTVSASKEAVHVHAGATLQTFIDTVKSINPDCRLIDVSRASCSSKQIRNQRKFGGEAGWKRTNSEILVFLHAVNAKLTVYTDSQHTVSIREWDGRGIITMISYFPHQIDKIELQRFSVLPSAPAIVIAAGCRRNGQFEIAIGGTATTIQTFVLPIHNWTESSAAHIAKKAVSQFYSDHFGSPEYKESLIATAVKRVVEAL